MTTIRVEVPPRGYDVLVGPVESGLERIRDLACGLAPIVVNADIDARRLANFLERAS